MCLSIFAPYGYECGGRHSPQPQALCSDVWIRLDPSRRHRPYRHTPSVYSSPADEHLSCTARGGWRTIGSGEDATRGGLRCEGEKGCWRCSIGRWRRALRGSGIPGRRGTARRGSPRGSATRAPAPSPSPSAPAAPTPSPTPPTARAPSSPGDPLARSPPRAFSFPNPWRVSSPDLWLIRLFAATDEIFCLFQGTIENIAVLKQQYGLHNKGSTEINIIIEAYRTLRDRGPYPADQVVRDINGKFAFVLYDCSNNSVFMATVSEFQSQRLIQSCYICFHFSVYGWTS